MNAIWSKAQGRLLRLERYRAKVVVASGSVRSGKTESGLVGFLIWLSRHYIAHTFLVAAYSRVQVYENLLPTIRRLAQDRDIGLKENIRDKYVLLGGNKILLYDVSDSTAVSKLQGLTLAGAYLDDAGNIRRMFVDEVIQRCSSPGAKVLLSCNPEGPGHWIKTDIIDGDVDSALLEFGLRDNPVLNPEYVRFLLQTLSGHMLERRVFGRWAASQGLIWPHIETHAGMPPGFTPQWLDLAMDCARSSSSHAVFVAVDGQRAAVVGEWTYSQRRQGDRDAEWQVKDMASAFRACAVRHDLEGDPRRAWYDPAAAAFGSELRELFGTRTRKADNDVKAGIEFTRGALDKGRLTVDRDACPELLRQMSVYEWDEHAAARGEDKPVKHFDHGCDALRYWLFSSRFAHRKAAPPRVVRRKRPSERRTGSERLLAEQWT